MKTLAIERFFLKTASGTGTMPDCLFFTSTGEQLPYSDAADTGTLAASTTLRSVNTIWKETHTTGQDTYDATLVYKNGRIAGILTGAITGAAVQVFLGDQVSTAVATAAVGERLAIGFVPQSVINRALAQGDLVCVINGGDRDFGSPFSSATSSAGAGAGNPSVANFTFRMPTAGVAYFQPTDINGKDISGVLTATLTADVNYDLADIYTLPAGTAGGYFLSSVPFWWNSSAGAVTPVLLHSSEAYFAIGSASGTNLPATTAFDPMSLNPYVFLDCTDKTTMFTAETATILAGATPVAATNDTVQVMYDKGSAGLILRQGTAGSRPTYNSTLFGGAGGLSFDGSADVLKDANCDITIPKPRTVLMVVNATNYTAARMVGGASAFGTNVFGYRLTITNGRPQIDFQSVSNYPLAAGSEITAATDVAIMLTINGDTASTARIKGRTQTTDLGVNTGLGATAAGVITDYTLGGDDNGGFMLGSIGLLAEFPVLTLAQQSRLLSWATNKFGL